MSNGPMRVPLEIYDRIIGLTDFQTAEQLHHTRAIAQLYERAIHTWSWAAQEGHLDVLKWLHEKDIEEIDPQLPRNLYIFHFWREYSMLYDATQAGHVEVVEWLKKNRPVLQREPHLWPVVESNATKNWLDGWMDGN